jgi:riboflavin transporter FmnP
MEMFKLGLDDKHEHITERGDRQKLAYCRQEDLPSTIPVKIVCFILGIGAGMSMFSGRGVLALLQGIVSIMFAIEGFWGAVQYNRIMLRRLIYFFVFLFIFSIVVGVLNFVLVDEYCDSNEGEANRDECLRTATTFAILSLGFGAIIGPILLLTIGIFYRRLSNVMERSDVINRAQALRRNRE